MPLILHFLTIDAETIEKQAFCLKLSRKSISPTDSASKPTVEPSYEALDFLDAALLLCLIRLQHVDPFYKTLRTFYALLGLYFHSYCGGNYQHDGQFTSLFNLPNPSKVKLINDRYTVFGNHTDSISAAAD